MSNAGDKPVVTLLPCPFCGGEALRFTIGDDEPNNAGGDVITCTKCQASSHVEFCRKENLVDRWNTRHREQDTLSRGGRDVGREAMRQACIAIVRSQQQYEGSDFPVCNLIVHLIEHLPGFDARTAALGDLPSRLMGWAMKARVQRRDRIELDLETVDQILAALSTAPASPEQADQADVLREALKEAYRKGATDVHNYWVKNPGEPP